MYTNTTVVIAVLLGFSADIKLAELILAIIVGLISDVVEEVSVASKNTSYIFWSSTTSVNSSNSYTSISVMMSSRLLVLLHLPV